VRRDWQPHYAAHVKTGASIADVRYWVGMFSNDPTSGGSNPSGYDLAALRFDTSAGDTNWMCCTKDATTLTATSSGVAPAANTAYTFRIEQDASEARFYINGSLVATITTNLPTSSTGIGAMVTLTTLAASAKTVKYGRQWVSFVG
jgi:hypothetical protein